MCTSAGAGVDVDSDGYRVEQRTETEQCSQTEEERELEDGRAKETRRHQVKEVRLEEVKSRESEPRPATAEEIRALLDAEFSGTGGGGGGGAEIQTSHEITVEEFTRVERKHEKTDGGTGDKQTETTTTEGRRTELVSEQPQWKMKTEKSLEATESSPKQLISLPIVSADAQGRVDASLPQATVEVVAPSVALSTQAAAKPPKSKGGFFSKFKLAPKGKGVAEVGDAPGAEAAVGGAPSKPDVTGEVGAEPMDVSADVSAEVSTDWLSKHHKVKQKRHVIEEVVLEDSDKFYEEAQKRPKLFLREKKKADKENVEPVVERRRSTGEVPVVSAVSPQTESAANASSEELLRFVVEYDLPASKLDENVPKGKKRWTMPIFTTGKKDETADVGGEPAADKKRKTGEKQEEVVVEEEDLFTDTSPERKGFGFLKMKPGQAVEPQIETVTYIVRGPPPGSYVKVEPSMEADEGGDLSTNAKAGLHGSIEFPKLKMFERKQKTPSSEDGEASLQKTDDRKFIPHMQLRSKYAKFGKLCAKGDVVSYHSTFATLPEEMSGREIKWPQLKVHYGGKYVLAIEQVTPDTETYVIEHIEQLPCDSDPDKMDTDACFPKLRFALSSKPLADSHGAHGAVVYKVDHQMDSGVSADDKSRDRMQWPDLKLTFTAPPSGQTENDGQKARTPVYVISQMRPVPNVIAGTGAEAPNVQLHFGNVKDISEEQITFVVEHPDRPVSVADEHGGRLFEVPKFKPHFGTWPGKHADTAPPAFSASLTCIDEMPVEAQADSGVTWPKLNFHFADKPAQDASQTIPYKEIVPYVVEQQLPKPADDTSDIQWPTVGLDFNARTATLIDVKDYSGKTVTYAAEKGEVKTSGDTEAKSAEKLRWPKFNVHFDTKPSQRHGEESGTVTYVFAQPAELNLSKVDSRGGVHWPKFDMHIGAKLPKWKTSDSLQEPETVTYIVEEPAPESKRKGLQIEWPKVDFRFGKKTKTEEREQEVEPETVTYIIEQPLPTESGAEDRKTRYRVEWPKFNLQFGGKQKKPEDIPSETEVTYVVQEIVPEPSVDENKPEVHWPKLKIRLGAKSKDKHPSMEGIDETVTYVVEQPSPDIGGRTKKGFHLPKPSLHIGGKSAAEDQTVTYVVETPPPTDSAAERQQQLRVKLPKLNVHFGLKKAKYGEGNGDTGSEIVTYVVEQIVPVDRDSERVREGTDLPKFRWQFGRKGKDKDDVSETLSEEKVTYIVEAPSPSAERKGGFGVNVPKPKFDLRFRKKPRKDEDQMDTESENAPYVLEQEMPDDSGDRKRKLHIEWPKLKIPRFKGRAATGDGGAAYIVEEIAPVPTEDSHDVSATGGIRWPKLNVKFGRKTSDPAAEGETNTVTYVVEQPSAELKESGGFHWPKFNLHLR